MRENAAAARRFARASALGGALATFVFCWMITNARWDFFAKQPFGEIHDAQARSLFHGHWDVPLSVVGIEGFFIHGRYYTYFGPFLAVLRMPVLLVTDRLDGRLTILSMLLAFVVLLAVSAHLHWRIRVALRGDAPISTLETVSAAVFTFAVGAGSIVAFLASRGLVYHEVEMWGVAWAVATTDALVGFALRPSRRGAIVAVICATAALMTRVSVGVGAVAAVGIVAVAQLLRTVERPRWLHALGRLSPGPDAAGRRHVAVMFAGVLIAGALYAGVNIARFGSPYNLPLDKQVFTLTGDAQRRAALDHNGGSLFGPKFVPTNVVQYARPDALRLSSRFPWVDFPRKRATVIGDVVFDTIDRSSSIPASMPGFTLLAIVGLIVLVRPRRSGGPLDVATLWPPVIGGVIGTAFVLTIAFIAHRYLADFFPPLLLLATVGVQRVIGAAARTPLRGRRLAGAVALAVVFVAGAWISFGLGRVYQRPVPPNDPNYSRGVSGSAAARP